MNADIIRISDEEAQLQCEVTAIALGVLENTEGCELVETLNDALESGNFEQMRSLKRVFEALPERMQLCLLRGLGPPEEARYAVRLLEEVMRDLIEGEQVMVCRATDLLNHRTTAVTEKR